MKNPLLIGAASCFVSVIFWVIILLSLWLEGEYSLMAAGVYILWIAIGIPLALIFSIWSLFLTYKKVKVDESPVLASVMKARLVSGASIVLIVVPVCLMFFVA